MVAETSMVSGLSGRYAVALFDLAKENSELDAVGIDLDRLGKLITDSADLSRLVRSPVLSREEQGKGMNAVAERAELSALTQRFVALLARNRRLFALKDITQTYHALLSNYRDEKTAEIISAKPLDEVQMAAISSSLSRAVGSDVKVVDSVDETLIGGLIIKVGSRMVDSSLRTKLQNLQLAMKGVR